MPLIVAVPEVVGLNITEQAEVPVVPGDNVQAVGAKDPGRSLEKATFPLGVEMVPVAESVTVAVHVVDEPTMIDDGVQFTDVVVGLFETM